LADPTYDVFMSFSGVDREAGRALTRELVMTGVSVFFDEQEIEPFDSVSDTIWRALANSKCLVAYYSAAYAVRPACQSELMAAYLAALSQGEPRRRVLVINPEPDTLHLRPIDLADAKFLLPSVGEAEIARLVAKQAAMFEGCLGAVRPPRPARLPPKLSGLVWTLVGRYVELWDLHTALFTADHWYIEDSPSGSVAWVHGLPGAGKTALVAAYAWRFASAFPGGVSWLTLAGVDPAQAGPAVRERFARELRRIAVHLGVAVRTVPDDQLVDVAISALCEAGRATLWVVDDIPNGVDAEALLDALPVLPDCGARIVLVSDSQVFADQHIRNVGVGGLPGTDARAVLDRYLGPDSGTDAEARDRIVDDLGGHAAALVATGRYLRGRERLTATPERLSDSVFHPLRRLLDRLTDAELTLLREVGQRDDLTVSPKLLDLPELVDIDVPETVAALDARGVVSGTGRSRRFEPVVVRAVR
jgi:hypothetical protein